MRSVDLERWVASHPSTTTLAITALSLVAVPFVVPAQVVSVVVFDAVGLDAIAPAVVLFGLVPALSVAFVPGAYATRRASARIGVAVAVAVTALACALALSVLDFYAMCGPC